MKFDKLLSRREFGLATGAVAFPLSSRTAASKTKQRVVVIGGGVGGATVAKYLAATLDSLDISLIEPKTRYTTCFHSNLYLAGLRSLESLTHGYDALSGRYGVKVVHDFAVSIDPVARIIQVESGAKLPYDRLVVSPGIAFRFGEITGYDEAASEIMPHAWNAGSQTVLLRRQLESMEDGGLFVIAAPREPFRYPAGPYERASMVAYYFRQFKQRSKILILDDKDSFFEQDLFEDAWRRHYPGMIEWLPVGSTGGVTAVDTGARSVKTTGDTFRAAVANVIPSQMAGQLARTAGLADQTGWCPIDPQTFESTLQPGIHVIGDAASAGDMPKSAFAANSQAKACAFAIAAALTGTEYPIPHLFSSCYTFLAGDDAVFDAVSFARSGDAIKIRDIYTSKVGESAGTRRKTVQRASGWYDAFTQDVFG